MKINNYMYEKGLQENDLKNLIKDVFYVDFYYPKILSINDSLVLTFYSKSKDALEDLMFFIYKSPLEEILDLEISSHQNEKGFWILFLEMEKTENVEDKVEYLLNEIKTLTCVEKWKIKILGSNKIQDFNKKILKKYLNLKIK